MDHKQNIQEHLNKATIMVVLGEIALNRAKTENDYISIKIMEFKMKQLHNEVYFFENLLKEIKDENQNLNIN